MLTPEVDPTLAYPAVDPGMGEVLDHRCVSGMALERRSMGQSDRASSEGSGCQPVTERGQPPRVLVIGLDGATFDLLDPWMARGLMPNLQRLDSEGSRAVLRSVMPPVTAPAWVSFATGVRPGRHGVFDFRKRETGQLSRRLISSRDVRAPAVWDMLADAGLRVGLVNVPVTYPLSDRTAFAISDMLTPSTDVRFTHPPSLYGDLKPELGDYIIDAPPSHLRGSKQIDPFLDGLEHCTRQRARYTAHLLRNREWDFAMVVFVSTDRLQHVLWDALSGDFALYPATPALVRAKEKAERFVSVLDELIGEILAVCPAATDVLVVSDHGFGPLRRKFRANKWLAQRGLLTPSRRRGMLGRMVASADVLRLRHRVARILARGKTPGAIPFWRWINWDRTRAYAASVTEMGIYVNLRGREARGIVSPGEEYEEVRDNVLRGLRELRHPGTDKPAVTMAARREELFDGPHLEEAPDVVFILDDGECTMDLRLEGPLFEAASWRTGTGMHRFGGVLIASGPRIRRGQHLGEVDIIDVAPTVLRLFGLPASESLEGRVPEGLLVAGAAGASTGVASPPRQAGGEEQTGAGDEGGSAYTDEEARQVEERLRRLGYL